MTAAIKLGWLLGLAGCMHRSQPPRELFGDADSDGRLRLHELSKASARDGERHHRPLSHDGCRARSAVEQSEFADKAPCTDGQRGAAGDCDRDLPLQDHEEFTCRVAANNERRGIAESSDACGFRHLSALPLAESREEW